MFCVQCTDVAADLDMWPRGGQYICGDCNPGYQKRNANSTASDCVGKLSLQSVHTGGLAVKFKEIKQGLLAHNVKILKQIKMHLLRKTKASFPKIELFSIHVHNINNIFMEHK